MFLRGILSSIFFFLLLFYTSLFAIPAGYDVATYDVYGLYNRAYTVGDIQLSSGAVRFAEPDLVLSGLIPGSELSITRQYLSSNFLSDPSISASYIQDSASWKWGHGIGKGWSLNVMMRAFVSTNGLVPSKNGYMAPRPELQHVVIDSADGVSEYYYDQSLNGFKSKDPANLNRIFFCDTSTYRTLEMPLTPFNGPFSGIPNALRLMTPDGKEYIFKDVFFTTVYADPSLDIQKMNKQWTSIKGYNLSEIWDGGNTILFQYETFNLSDRSLNWGHVYKMLVDQMLLDLWGMNLQSIKGEIYTFFKFDTSRLKSISDPFGRKVDFEYLGNSTSKNDPSDGIVSKIKYKNTSGSTSEVKYGYDSNLNLVSVQKDDLPPVRYGYDKIDYGEVTRALWYLYFFPLQYKMNMSGYLVSSVQSPLGGIVRYAYTSSVYKNPVVSSKVISDGQTQKTYTFSYPGPEGIKQSTYQPAWSSQTLMYFANVNVDCPSEEEDEQYLFDRGFLIKKVKGKFETSYVWDFDKGRLSREQSKIDSQLQKEMAYEGYNSDNLPLKIVLYNHLGVPILKTERVYRPNPTAIFSTSLLVNVLFTICFMFLLLYKKKR